MNTIAGNINNYCCNSYDGSWHFEVDHVIIKEQCLGAEMFSSDLITLHLIVECLCIDLVYMFSIVPYNNTRSTIVVIEVIHRIKLLSHR